MAMVRSGAPFSGNNLFSKFDADHIHKYLDYSRKDDEDAFHLRKRSQIFQLIYILLGISFFVFLIVFLLPSDKSLLNDILKYFFGFIGGFGGGFGTKYYLDRKRDPK